MPVSPIKKLIAAIVVLAVLAFGIYAVYQARKNSEPKQPEPASEVKVFPEVKTLPNEQLSSLFPADFPWEQGSEITKNFETQVKGKQQATRQYVTSKTIAQAAAAWKSYLESKGWKLSEPFNESGARVISATLDKDGLVVKFIEDTQNRKMVVDVSLSREVATVR